MINTIKKINCFLLLVVLFSSCEDFIEKNISGGHIVIISPPSGTTTNVLTQTFWWEDLKGAEKYEIQIVAPDFSSVQQLVLDSDLVDNKFTYAFSSPGIYSWRVRGKNNGHETEYTTAVFTIDSTLDLSNQIVSLVEPGDNTISAATSVTYRWANIYYANLFRFQLEDGMTGSLIKDTALTGLSVTLAMDTGTFIWRVRAENNLSTSPFSSRTIYIDRSAPQVSQIITPAYGDSLSNPVNLTWNRNGNAVSDSLFVYQDSLLTIPVVLTLSIDNFYSFTGTISRNYYWRLKSIDGAGNVSEYSATYRFYIQ